MTATSRRAFVALAPLATLASACSKAPAPPSPTRAAPTSTAQPTAPPVGATSTPDPTPAAAAVAVPTFVATPPAESSSRASAPSLSTPTPVAPALIDGRPAFSDVSQVAPTDAIAFLSGRDPHYPGSGPSQVRNFSPSDILETMDTAVLDQVRQNQGESALQKVYGVIGADILAAARQLYPDRWVLLALDAGHGGNPSYFWDPGSDGTEAGHTRGVAAAIGRLAKQPENRRILVRQLFNDAIADNFGLGANGTQRAPRASVSTILMRQVRAAMLGVETHAWNLANPGPTNQTVLHEVSVHFNAGAGGALVLHQGDTVSPEFMKASIAFGQQYLHRVVPDLNATGVLPDVLTLWGGTGLHDDVMMYQPPYLKGLTPTNHYVPRYGELQGSSFTPRLIQMVLGHQANRGTG